MEQLPPKVPSMATHNWPSFPFQNSWVDEFLDFSTARRSMHRRTTRDPVAFVETPPFMEESGHNNNHSGGSTNGFERLDDEQLRDMFCDDMADVGPTTRSSSNPSSQSTADQNGSDNGEEKKTATAVVEGEGEAERLVQRPKDEPGEVYSSCKPPVKTQPPSKASDSASGDAIADPKRIKRILANRQSAQRSRVRKLQYISELERSLTTLESEVSALSPRVAFLDHQRLLLNVDNSALKQRIAALAQDKIFKDAHQEVLRKDIERLRKIYHEQNMKKMGQKVAAEASQPPVATTYESVSF